MNYFRNKFFIYFSISICITLFWGCEKNQITPVESQGYTADFDSVWTNFNKKYPLFTYKKINWNNIYSEYSNKFKDISLEERNQLLIKMLTIFKDPHIVISNPVTNIGWSYAPSNLQTNFNEQFITKFISTFNWHNENDSWGWGNFDNIGYIRIIYLYSESIDTLKFDMVLDSLKNTKGLIIDLRKEYGGNLLVCEAIWNRFTNLNFEVGYLLYRNGKGHDDFAPKDYVYTIPRGNWQYLKPVIVLIGQLCGSAGEIFAQTFSNFNNSILIGDTTLGAVEAPSEFTLSDGTTYTVPIVAYYDIDGKPLEWRGVPPDIYFDPTEVANNTNEDIIIEKAIDIINQNSNNYLKNHSANSR